MDSLRYYEVAVESPLPPLTYHSLELLSPGTVVRCPLGQTRTVKGVVLRATQKPEMETKEILDHLYPLEPKFFQFITWLSQYYHHPLGEVLRAATPKEKRSEAKAIKTFAPKNVELNEIQRKIYEKIVENPKTPHLIFGVTGSGKTEIYCELIKKVIAESGQVIFLVPEISLTAALHQRIEERLGMTVPIIHSSISEIQRSKIYSGFEEGTIPIILGARSSILYPAKNLKLIIVDEEHDSSYKQDARLLYNARDVAIYRAKLENAFVILGSATPSLESYQNAEQNKYMMHELFLRAKNSKLPNIELIDLRKVSLKPGALITEPLQDEIREKLKNKEQVILYLGRRGYASSVVCKDCGHILQCDACAISLTFYKRSNKLCCHLCGDKKKFVEKCGECKSENLELLGGGTEALEEELKACFPEARVDRLDRSIITSQKRLEGVIENMREKNTDILIGTQMITKGYDFPNVTLVGIIMADLQLFAPHFRSVEQTFQTLVQVAGRAGRAEIPGKVLIQTYNPDHPIYNFLIDQDAKAFISHELIDRKNFFYPPYSFLLEIRAESKNEHELMASLESAAKRIRSNFPNTTLLGPAPAEVPKVKNIYHAHVIVKSSDRASLQQICKLLESFDAEPRLVLNVDPL